MSQLLILATISEYLKKHPITHTYHVYKPVAARDGQFTVLAGDSFRFQQNVVLRWKMDLGYKRIFKYFHSGKRALHLSSEPREQVKRKLDDNI